MDRVPFDPKEMEPIGFIPAPFPGHPPTPVFNTPISRKENFLLLVNGEKPLWMPHIQEFLTINPSCMPDCWARGIVTRPGPPPTPDQCGGKDMFGVEWEYLPDSHGSMVRPGAPLVKDLEHWEEDIVFPDIESWDWAGCAAETEAMRSDGRIVKITLMTGLFERLISFVDMTDAMVSLIDDETKPAVHRLFSRLCDLYDALFAKFKQYFNADVVWFHDDWGSQRSPFFSQETVREMLLPYIKRCSESAHRHGLLFELHSCGQVELLLPAMVEAGCDMWNGQQINDKKKMAELYGDKIICDSIPDELPPTATPEERAENIRRYLQDYTGLRTYCGMSFTMPPDEYRNVYEQSRILFNQ